MVWYGLHHEFLMGENSTVLRRSSSGPIQSGPIYLPWACPFINLPSGLVLFFPTDPMSTFYELILSLNFLLFEQ